MDQTGQYSQEFINQLNNTPQKSGFNFGNKAKLPLVIAGLAIVTLVVVIIGWLLVSSRPNLSRLLEQLVSQTEATKKLSTDYHKKLSSTTLRETNATLQATLTNLSRDVNNHRQTLATKKDQVDKPKPVSLKAVEDRLQMAILNENLDRKFSSELRFQIDQTMILMQQAYKATSNPDLKKLLDDNYKNLQTLQEEIKKLNLN